VSSTNRLVYCECHLEWKACTVSVGRLMKFDCYSKKCNHFMWFNIGRMMKDDRCLIKTIKTENITHKHNIIVIVLS